MSNLVCLSEENSNVNLTALSNAVYSVLNQNDELLAEISYVSKEEIKRLNLEFRNIDKVTDVLSFPTLDNIRGKVVKKSDFPLDVGDDGRIFIGSIAVCVEVASVQANEYGHSLTREITYLICHGLLHLFGYDHLNDIDKAEMRNLEEIIMKKIQVNR